MLTALIEDRTLDEVGNRSVVDFYKGTGAITTIFARSGTGQMYSFSFDEVKALIDIVVPEAGNDIHVIAGTSGTFPGRTRDKLPEEEKYIEETLELSKYAEDRGATGVVVLPLGLTPSRNFPDKIFDFYQRVNDAVDVPIIIYEPPGVVAPYSLTPQLLARIADLPNLKGMKLSSSDMLKFGLLCDAIKDLDFTMISGHEGAFLSSLVMGAGGCIGGGCNTHPWVIRAVFDAFMEGDMEGARRAQFEVNKLLGVKFGIPDPYAAESLHTSKLYLARKGVKIKPYQWGRRSFDHSRMDDIEGAIDAAVASVTD
jgi:4-hydroxy-tetrahydrodipicolinate synthase